ncbi:hypothetical protein [Nocardia gipuzkoensis]
MSTADDAASEQEPERNLAAELDEVRKTIEANQRAADRLWVPSSVIERLLWQVCGAWETVIEQVRFFHYVLHENPPIEPPFPHPDGENVARDMRRIAKKTNFGCPATPSGQKSASVPRQCATTLVTCCTSNPLTGRRPTSP